MHQPASVYQRYLDLQKYVGWSVAQAERVKQAAPLVAPHFSELVEAFYLQIRAHEATWRVITGGEAQVERLKQTLRRWLEELFSGEYDEAYVERRWRVGYRHVEIGLDQAYANAALSLLRGKIVALLCHSLSDPAGEKLAPSVASHDLLAMVEAVNALLDLDLAIIEDAYQTAYAQRMQQIERLAAIGQMSAGVAHELRNPLNVIRTSVYYLLHAQNIPPEKVSEHLRRIDAQTCLADSVITALANFTRLPSPEMKAIDLATCLREALATVPVGRQIELETHVPANLPRVRGDAAQLGIVFANLLRNACEAMLEGGQLTLSVAAENGEVVVRVRDTGSGIPPELIERITEPLFTTKPRGIGLGLAISRAILEKHGAHLEVESRVGAGSTFVVRLAGEGAA